MLFFVEQVLQLSQEKKELKVFLCYMLTFILLVCKATKAL